MLAGRRDTSRSQTALAAGIAGLVLVVAVAVMLLGRAGGFSRLAPASGAIVPPLPGLTIDDGGDAGPVVTSLRSNSEAERRGVRVGDTIDAIDGRAVRDVAALRVAVATQPAAGPVSLHIRRGNAVWAVALDRRDPPEHAGQRHDPEDPPRRGR